MNVHRAIVIGLWLLTAIGCSGATGGKEVLRSPDPVMEMVQQGLFELNGNIDELNRHIAELQQLRPVSDPRLQELHALDLAGWQLHLQQWMLQREHLMFSEHEIQRVRADPRDKHTIRTQWLTRQQQFVTALNDFLAQRQTLERKRLEVESQVLEHYFK